MTIKSTVNISDDYYTDKIDRRGYFKLCRGVTCISMCSRLRIFKSIYNFIKNSEIGKYYVPLPIDSYHLTIFGMDIDNIDKNQIKKIETVINNSFPSNYEKEIIYDDNSKKSSFFQKFGILILNGFGIDTYRLKVRMNEKFNEKKVTIKDVFVNKVIGLNVDFMEEEDHKTFRYLRNKFKNREEKPFHITLAYKFNDKIPINSKFYSDVLKLTKILEKIKFIGLMKPDIRYYDSMRCFFIKQEKKSFFEIS